MKDLFITMGIYIGAAAVSFGAGAYCVNKIPEGIKHIKGQRKAFVVDENGKKIKVPCKVVWN